MSGNAGNRPHLQEELPALGIIILLGENLAEAGKDSEAVPGEQGAVALRRGLAQLPPSQPLPDSSAPSSPPGCFPPGCPKPVDGAGLQGRHHSIH